MNGGSLTIQHLELIYTLRIAPRICRQRLVGIRLLREYVEESDWPKVSDTQQSSNSRSKGK